MKTTAFNSPKTRKTKIGEGVYIPPLNSPLLVELMRSSLVRRRVKLCEVKGERESFEAALENCFGKSVNAIIY